MQLVNNVRVRGPEAQRAMTQAMVTFESRPAKAYLAAYNIAQFAGWLFVLVRLVENGLREFDIRLAYAAVGILVVRLQLVAFLEVIHGCIGLTRSGPLTAFLQWAGRTHVLVAIIARLPEVQRSPSVFLTFASWSLAEVVRYPQYGLSTLQVCPKWLTWLRYTTFIFLYPAGVYGEMYTMYLALGPMRRKHLYARLFKAAPIGYDQFVIGLLLVYPLLFLVLYRHMFKQRQAKLRTGRRRERRPQREQ